MNANRDEDFYLDCRSPLARLNLDVAFGRSGGKIIWQPRIGCWYDDRMFTDTPFPEPYTGMTLRQIYSELGCSNRNYTFNSCFKRVYDERVRFSSRELGLHRMENRIDTPVGSITQVERSNTSNPGRFPEKWWIACEDDMKVMIWIEEHMNWRWDEKSYRQNLQIWEGCGAPAIYMPRVSIQELFVTTMGVENTIYALADYPDTVEAYFEAMSASHMREIDLINESPVNLVNFGDNIHAGVLSPRLFEKYVLPEYLKRTEKLHRAGKFTFAHWDGDVGPLLPYVRQCGLDGIEAVTPKPQGDVTLAEVREAFGDKMFLVDGIAAILFCEDFTLDELEAQVRECIDLFAPNLILGISDELPSNGSLERIKFVGEIVDAYNKSISPV